MTRERERERERRGGDGRWCGVAGGEVDTSIRYTYIHQAGTTLLVVPWSLTKVSLVIVAFI